MKYYVLKCNIDSKDLKEENYGVVLVNDDRSREYSCNISDDVFKVQSLVDMMNDYNVEPYQAFEIIEDFKYNKQIILHT